MNAIIECSSLSKSFRGIRALDGFEFTLPARTSAGLVGPNGAGKTTLYAMLCGYLKPDAGHARILGHVPGSVQLKGRIGLLPQDSAMLQSITVEPQLLFLARLQGFNARSANREVARITDLLKIEHLLNQFPETLSHGQRKKITLAQALIGNPELLLLDEPTAGLDPAAAEDVRNLIHNLRSTYTLIISSHNLDEIKSICDEIIIINKGKLVRHTRIADLVEHDRCLTLRLAQPPEQAILESLGRLPGIISVVTNPAQPQRISVTFAHENPDQIQLALLTELQRHGSTVLEFNRGAAFAGKVVELVGKP